MRVHRFLSQTPLELAHICFQCVWPSHNVSWDTQTPMHYMYVIQWQFDLIRFGTIWNTRDHLENERVRKEPPSRVQERSRVPQDRPKCWQVQHNNTQVHPKSGPRTSQGRLKSGQICLNSGEIRPKSGQRQLKSNPRAPKGLSRGPQGCPREL